jgi:hypothetical protein
MLIMTNSSNGEGVCSGLLENVLGHTFTPLEWEGFKTSPKRQRQPSVMAPREGQVTAPATWLRSAMVVSRQFEWHSPS